MSRTAGLTVESSQKTNENNNRDSSIEPHSHCQSSPLDLDILANPQNITNPFIVRF